MPSEIRSFCAEFLERCRLVFSRYIDKLPADDAIFALLRERFQEAQSAIFMS